MCISRPKPPKVAETLPPPIVNPVTEDEAVIRERNRERRRSAAREGRQSTLLTGGASAPTGQAKTLLGA